jgi:phage tail sheath protein FI
MADKFLHGVEVVELNDGARPIQTVASSVIGLIGTAPKGPVNTPTLILGSPSEATAIFGEDTDGYTIPAALKGIFDQAGAMVVVINVADPENENHLDDNGDLDPTKITMSDIIGGTNADGTYFGMQCLLASQSECKVQPRILIAPGFTHDTTNGTNPVVTAMLQLADRMRAIAVADCPNGTKEDAVDYAESFDSARLFCVYPWAKVYKNDAVVIEPLSARIAGLIAKIDNDLGFWWSPSNQIINGIVGLSKPIDWTLGDSVCVANYLNEHKVATVIESNGFKLWGNRPTATDTKWTFLSVRRTSDMINDSLMRAHLWAVDRNITKTYVSDVADMVNKYLRDLIGDGAILGGECWADSSQNTQEQIAQGKITFDFDFTAPQPAEHITFRSRMTNNYLTEIFE